MTVTVNTTNIQPYPPPGHHICKDVEKMMESIMYPACVVIRAKVKKMEERDGPRFIV